jgi:hypothetical protein
MKKLLIGLLALGSLSALANTDFTYYQIASCKIYNNFKYSEVNLHKRGWVSDDNKEAIITLKGKGGESTLLSAEIEIDNEQTSTNDKIKKIRSRADANHGISIYINEFGRHLNKKNGSVNFVGVGTFEAKCRLY